MSKLKVFWTPAPFAFRVLLYVNARRIPYESKMISFENKEHKTPEFLKMNPRGRIPTIADGDTYVHESMAIIDYLEHKYTDYKKYPSLVGNSLKERANIMVKANEVHANFNLVRIAHPLIFQNPKDWDLNELSKAWKDTVSELNIYNQWLEGNSFAAGNSFSVADCILFPIINFLDRNGMDWKGHGFKNLETYHKIVTETETYTKAYPQSWREAEKTSKVGELLDHLKKIN